MTPDAEMREAKLPIEEMLRLVLACHDGRMLMSDALREMYTLGLAAGRKGAMEEAAKACEELAQDAWHRYKTGHGPQRGNTYVEGQSDAADACAQRIRALTPQDAEK